MEIVSSGSTVFSAAKAEREIPKIRNRKINTKKNFQLLLIFEKREDFLCIVQTLIFYANFPFVLSNSSLVIDIAIFKA